MREGNMAMTAQAKFGHVITVTASTDGAGNPARWAIQYATGSRLAAASDANSMRRGAVGAIMEYTRIRIAIHERCMSRSCGSGIAQALSVAMLTALSSMNASPAFTFIEEAALERRR